MNRRSESDGCVLTDESTTTTTTTSPRGRGNAADTASFYSTASRRSAAAAAGRRVVSRGGRTATEPTRPVQGPPPSRRGLCTDRCRADEVRARTATEPTRSVQGPPPSRRGLCTDRCRVRPPDSRCSVDPSAPDRVVVTRATDDAKCPSITSSNDRRTGAPFSTTSLCESLPPPCSSSAYTSVSA